MSFFLKSNRPTFDLEQDFKNRPELRPASVFNPVRAAVRFVLIFLWGFIVFCTQSTLQLLPFNGKVRFPRAFWNGICRISGLQVRVLGEMAGRPNVGVFRNPSIRPVLYVANHTSWLDIVVLGKLLPTIFISRTAIGEWPLVGPLTKCGGTVYLSKDPKKTKEEVDLINSRMQEGYNITLFPEGTTTAGVTPLPFLSSIFALASPHLKKDPKAVLPLVQPVSVLFDRLEGLPVGRSRRSTVFSWFGDMTFFPHLWQLLQWKSMRATVLFHEPLDPEDFKSRKALAAASREIIAHGLDALKQDRHFDPEDPLSE